MSEHRTLLRSASLITVITLLSRVLGYLRDLRFAFLLGAGVGFDAFVIAYRIPNLLRRLVGEGAVSAAFIPIFSRYLSSENRKEAWSFANAMITIATSVMSVVVVLGVLLSPWIVRLLAAGFLDTPGQDRIDNAAEPHHFSLHPLHQLVGSGDGGSEQLQQIRGPGLRAGST